ncbi:sensor histidine kinase [Rhizobium oryzicola]|uniref:histidine kinase n=1 Tax=Rhizobium oryzicola TaxID=1232668 RepID=A0ABT8SVB3_9HYPH|nr:HWE histidine kinase domain-containing protein [Rhizobium oryzicola]MDO1582245.1 HWE histidine kinase domain-containing protein [Rhizobium oryzicola]
MFDFPRDGGEMGRAIRAFNWSKTSMGAIDTWPVSLRSVVQMMVQQGHAICLFWGDDLNIVYNDAYRPFLGAKERGALGQPFQEIWSDVWEDVKPFVAEALAGRSTFTEDLRLIMHRNGYPEETFWTFSYSPLYDDAGRVAGLIDVAVDTTAAVKSRRNEELLRRELVHRVKNSVAVTTAVVSATMRHAETLEEARDTISKRIAALGKAQNLIHQSETDADLASIIRESMEAHLDEPQRLIVSGPDVRVSPQQAVGLSLAVYELATNALKYGALSTESGRIAISWSTREDKSFRFIWQESGGPPVQGPRRRGFGSRLTDQIVANYFSGTGVTLYERDGLMFELNGTLHNGFEDESEPQRTGDHAA